MKAVRAIGILTAAAIVSSPFFAFAKTYTPTDSTYRSSNASFSIFHPAFWIGNEKTYKTQNGSQIVLVTMQDQAEESAKITRYALVIHSDAAGVFGLPPALVAKLSNADLVNIYIDSFLRSSLAARITRQSVEFQNGGRVYVIDSSMIYFGIPTTMHDRFLFKDGKVHHVHGQYSSSDASGKSKVQKIVESLSV